MAVSVREQEIQRLVRFYRKAIRDLARAIKTTDFDRPRTSLLLQQAFLILDELDERTARWAKRNIASLYRSASREAQKDLTALGVALRSKRRTNAFTLINKQAIEALLLDPQVGFLSNAGFATQQIRNRMRTIQNQGRRLVQHNALFNEIIAQGAFLEGQPLNVVRDRLVSEMQSFESVSNLNLTSKVRKSFNPGEFIHQVSSVPYIQIPSPASSAGFRNLRLDSYAEMLARTKTSQASNLARRNQALRNDQALVQVSKNLPLHNDACALYLGKVFALTVAAKEEFGVPLVQELPNGGAPFHPNCTHQELLFVPEFRNQDEIDLAMIPPPRWALNRPFSVVEKEYKRRGGFANLEKFNTAAVILGRGTGGRVRRGNVSGDELDAIVRDEPQTPRRRRRPSG